MADRTLGILLFTLGGITRTMAGHDSKRYRASCYEERKDISHVNTAISSMHHSIRVTYALPANRKGLIRG